MRRFLRRVAVAAGIVSVGATGLSAQQQVAGGAITIGDAARLAAAQSTPVLAARLRTAEAQARVTQKRADLFPTLSTSATESGHTINSATFGFDFPTPEGEEPLLDPNGQIIGPVNLLDLRAHVTVPAFDLAARQRVAAARASVRASEAAANDVAERAAATAALAYLRAARARALVAARAADSTLADTLLIIARQQLQAGVGVGLDVTRAQSQLAGIHAQLIAARGELARSNLELIRAVGAPLDATFVLATPLDRINVDEPLPTVSDAVALALRERSDITAAERELDAEKQNVRATRAERLPTLSAFADNGAIGPRPSNLLNTYTWGVQLSLPIFDGSRRSGKVSELQAVASGLDLQRRELERQVTVEVRSALLDLTTARDQVVASRGRLQLAQLEYSQAQERFRAGVAGNADVVSASIALNAARNLSIDALASYAGARIGLARAQGTATRLP